MGTPITVQTVVNASLERVWECWTKPEHITKWTFASSDWEAPAAENDVRTGGRFKTTMAAKDKSVSFDFTGTYTNVNRQEVIEYDMDMAPGETQARHVKVTFENMSDGVRVTETFDPEGANPEEMQHAGWQAILNNFKKYVEKNLINKV